MRLSAPGDSSMSNGWIRNRAYVALKTTARFPNFPALVPTALSAALTDSLGWLEADSVTWLLKVFSSEGCWGWSKYIIIVLRQSEKGKNPAEFIKRKRWKPLSLIEAVWAMWKLSPVMPGFHTHLLPSALSRKTWGWWQLNTTYHQTTFTVKQWAKDNLRQLSETEAGFSPFLQGLDFPLSSLKLWTEWEYISVSYTQQKLCGHNCDDYFISTSANKSNEGLVQSSQRPAFSPPEISVEQFDFMLSV